MEALYVRIRYAAGLRRQITSEQALIPLTLRQEIKDLQSKIKSKASIDDEVLAAGRAFSERLRRAPKEEQERYRIRFSTATLPGSQALLQTRLQVRNPSVVESDSPGEIPPVASVPARSLQRLWRLRLANSRTRRSPRTISTKLQLPPM